MSDASPPPASDSASASTRCRPLDPLALPLRGPHLIEASAGTGKTFTIATLFVRLVVERGMSVDHILVVTFTEAAAAELRDRVRRRLQDVARALDGTAAADEALAPWLQRRTASHAEDLRRVRLALQTFDEAAISTIHGFCHRVLHDSAFETGVSFETELIANQQPLLDQAVRDYWARELYGADRRFVGHVLERGMIPPRLMPLAWIASSNPGIPLIPPGRAGGSAAVDEAPFRAAFGQARELWHTRGAEARELLLEHPGLHKSYYKPVDMRRWFSAADGFFHEADPGDRLGFVGLDKLGTSTLHKRTNKRWRDSGQVPTHPFFDACEALSSCTAPLRADLDRRQLDFKRGLVEFVGTELPRRKQVAGVQSFDDLLHRLDHALSRRRSGKELAAAIRDKYGAALIDEFQDTDPVQFRIFRNIYGGTDLPLLLIGDPKQAIYGFRGADVFAYLDAAQGVRPSRRHTMDTNWRSDPGLLRAIEHLFTVPQPFLLDGIDFVSVGARPGAEDALRCEGRPLAPFELKVQRKDERSVRVTPRGFINADWVKQELPRRVAADISKLLGGKTTLHGRPVRAGDIAVLSRTNAQAQLVQAALRDLGIPGVVYGDASVYETREADELERVLSAVAEPTTLGLLRAALTTELLGVTGGELEAMADDDEAWDHWVQLFRRWHTLWTQRGFIRMLRTLLTDLHLGKRMLELTDGERRMTNLLHLTELLHEASSREHLGPAGVLHWFSEQRGGDQKVASEAVKLRLERDDEAVQLITIHRSKGLEYPIVYCPYLWSADELRPAEIDNLKFHDPEHDNLLTLDIGFKPKGKQARLRHPNVARAQFESSAESLRLLYVALTRARHRCVVVWGPFDRFHHSALAYLLHAPQFDDGKAAVPNVADGLRDADDDALAAWLEERRHPTWAISELEADAERQPVPGPRSSAELRPRVASSAIDRLYRTTSFTGIVAGHGAVDPGDGQDHDQAVPLRERTGSALGDADTTTTLHTFPRGAHVGNFFHDVLEHVPFDAPDEILRGHVDSGLRRHSLSAEGRSELATAAVRHVLECPLNDAGLRLCDLPARHRLAELGFTMPVAAALTDAQGAGLALDPSSLRRAMGTDPTGLPEGYLDRLWGLNFLPVRGFLRGFIDLVFQHQGRWYVADYKTNDLGPHRSDYTADRLAAAMGHEHYVLQYHLYTVALCRHLALRQPDFDYDRDFGGALYLFLRGMHPQTGPSRGVFNERPPRARIEALGALLDAAGPGGTS